MAGGEGLKDNVAREEMVKEKIFEGEDLLPCPFCGNREIYYEKYITPVGMRYRVICGKCCASMDTGTAQNRYTVRELWNTRTTDKDGG